MAEAIQTGSYVNLSDAGFQEGYFATRQELVDLFDRCDIREDRVVSLKGISFGRADAVESIRNQNPESTPKSHFGPRIAEIVKLA